MPEKCIYISGQIINGIKYIEESFENKERSGKFICPLCEKIFIASFRNVKSKNTSSCGCGNSKYGYCYKYQFGDIVGQCIFIREIERNKIGTNYARKAEFKCWKCGNLFICRISSIKRGGVKTCGCLQRDGTLRKNYKHGLSNINKKGEPGYSEYKSFMAMKQRCHNPNHSSYKDYGGRGIKICERWLDKENGFENFLSDLGYKPDFKYSLERIDFQGNYCPENCKWADNLEQSLNKRTTIILSYSNKTKKINEWAKYFNISLSDITILLNMHNWNIKQTFDLLWPTIQF